MKKTVIFNTCIAALSAMMFFSCGNKQAKTQNVPEEKLITFHTWYYINSDGFYETASPKDAPKVIKKPYTEACRISGIGQTVADEISEKTPPIYAIVNHAGIIKFCENQAKLFADKMMFKDFTADGIVFMNDNPVFSFYKDVFFNNTLSTELSSHSKEQDISVLVQFDTKAETFFPILNTETLKLTPTAQVTDFYLDGKYWYYCIKDSKEDRTEFSYVKWNANSSLLTLLPNDPKLDKETNIDKKTKIGLEKISEAEFRKVKEPRNFSAAPERVRKLLSHLPEDFSFALTVKTAGGPSPRRFEKKVDDKEMNEAVVQLADTWVGTLFRDGTMYFSGALPGRRIVNNSKAIALRLPKLPEGFEYKDFGITGNYLYAVWEEVSFFETGRCGFISVDLNTVLYNQ